MDTTTITYSTLSEKELVRLLQEGHEGALRLLYDIHIKKLYYFVLRTAKLPELAEDVVQDVFIKIWENRQQIDPEQHFRTYLYTVARHHLLNLLKRLQHEVRILSEIKKQAGVAEHTTELQVDHSEINALLMEAVSKLPLQCKEIFVRCKMQGLSYRQVASDLNITEGTVNSQMVKALRVVRRHLGLKNAILVLIYLLNHARY